MKTHPCPLDARKPIIVRLQKAYEPPDELGSTYRLVHPFWRMQRALDEVENKVKVPFGMVPAEQHLAIRHITKTIDDQITGADLMDLRQNPQSSAETACPLHLSPSDPSHPGFRAP